MRLVDAGNLDFPNHFMSLKSETRKRRRSKFSALTNLTETNDVDPNAGAIIDGFVLLMR